MQPLQKAREDFKNGIISFPDLYEVFEKKATDIEKSNFWKAPVFDRQYHVLGMSQKQMDKEWERITGSE